MVLFVHRGQYRALSLQDNFVSRGRPKCILDPMSLLKALLSLQGLPQDRLAKDSCACLVSLGDFLCEFVPSLSLFKQEVVLLSCFQKGAPMCSRHPVCFTSILGHSEDLLCFIAFFIFPKSWKSSVGWKRGKVEFVSWNLLVPPLTPAAFLPVRQFLRRLAILHLSFLFLTLLLFTCT